MNGSTNCGGDSSMPGTLSGDVRRIVHELDADGQGYQTSEAASRLVEQYVSEGVCDADGDPKPKVKALMRLGAGVAFKNYRSDAKSEGRKRERAYALADSDQRDFAEVADGFDFEWLRVYAAWDE